MMKKALLALALCAGALSACTDETPTAPQPTNQPGGDPSTAPDHPVADLPE